LGEAITTGLTVSRFLVVAVEIGLTVSRFLVVAVETALAVSRFLVVAVETALAVSRFFFASSRRKEKAYKKKRRGEISLVATSDKASRLDCASF
jgi:membrane protein implicated in regulation of membrane protease activity